MQQPQVTLVLAAYALFCLQLALMIASYFNLLYDFVTTSNYLWVVICTLLSAFLTWCLVIQILDDPSPTPPEDAYSPEFCSFINDCLQKDADARPTCEQLLSHPFIKRYLKTNVDLASYVKSVVDPTERLKQIAEMLAIHYYLLFNGSDGIWHHMKTFYMEQSTFSFSEKVHVGQNDIFDSLSNIRKKLKGDRPREKIVHVVEKLHCRANGDTGVAIRVSGSFIVGNQFLVCGEGVKPEGMPSLDELSIDIPSKRVGQFREQFIMQPGNLMSCYYISKQDLYIIQSWMNVYRLVKSVFKLMYHGCGNFPLKLCFFEPHESCAFQPRPPNRITLGSLTGQQTWLQARCAHNRWKIVLVIIIKGKICCRIPVVGICCGTMKKNNRIQDTSSTLQQRE